MALRTARRLVVAVARLAPPAEPGQPKAEAAAVRSVVESSVHRTSLWTGSALLQDRRQLFKHSLTGNTQKPVAR
jgi:hypothetical protein